MRENALLFPNPVPDLDTFETMLIDFRRAIADATYLDKLAILKRDKKRKTLLESIRYLYVDTIAKGDESIILTSGFVPSKPQSSPEKIPSTEDFQAVPTIGTKAIKLRVKAWRRARMYQFEYRKKGTAGSWTTVLSSKSRHTVENLEELAEYEFRVCYVGRTGKSPYSEIISSRVY